MTSELEKWVKAIPEKTIEGELDSLRKERQEVDQKIEVREQALAMKRVFASEDGVEPEQASEPQPPSPIRRDLNPPFRGREAIRKVLAATPEKETWTIAEMLKAILDRGWTANTHAVQVNLSRMYRDEELSKVGMGVYCRPDYRRDLLASAQEAQE
jgi:hypothetical protein